MGAVESLGCPVWEPWSAVEVALGKGLDKWRGTQLPRTDVPVKYTCTKQEPSSADSADSRESPSRDNEGEECFLSTFSPRILCIYTFLTLSSRNYTIPKYTPDLLLPQSSFIWMISILLSVYPIKEIKICFPFSWSLMRLSPCVYQPFACSLGLLLLHKRESF